MKYTDLFVRTSKEAKQFDSTNATLLQKGGFIHQTMAGVYTFLPLGLRVLTNIERIVREEMDKIASEMLMSALSPRSLWKTTSRDGIDVLLEARGANDASRAKNDSSFILNPTHEDVLTPIAQQIKPSYKDLPFAVYQIQTKFRNEERPKSGLLRCREFRMKDLYSFHASSEDMKAFYEKVKQSYQAIFDRIGIGKDTMITRASGGDFTNDFSHEFQTTCETGEDIVFYNKEEDIYYNKEIAPENLKKTAKPIQTSEVGNIFPLNTKFSDAFGYTFADKDGSHKPVYMASYGIGTSRIMGVIVEKFHDDKGILWPAAVAPYQVYLANIGADASQIYTQLQKASIEVLWDNRESASAGEKLANADLLGIPVRAVVSKKTGDAVEIKKRNEDHAQMIPINELVKALS